MSSSRSPWIKRNYSADTKVRLLGRKEKLITPMLYDLLSCIAPHPDYDTIVKTIKKYIPKSQKVFTDGIGNIIIKVGENYTTMFSCHIDMVFRKTYFDDLKSKPKILNLFIAQDKERDKKSFVWGGIVTEYKNNSYIYTPTTLGADDKAGIFILINLIRAKVPGLYIFHVGEEIGGIGSSDIVTRSPGLVKGIDRAIAFDRMDYLDIIDRQRGAVCCSHKFVNAFADQLTDLIITPNKISKRFKGATGTFTDTANYTGLIPECTNLSVGYFCQHGSEECLNTLWLETILMPALLQVDWESLPIERTPYKLPKYKYPNPNWPKNNIESIGKYVTYASIDYNTQSDQLPPWTLKKGHIKSCSEVGMRRLIRRYLKETLSEFDIQQSILELLKENYDLKQKLEGIPPKKTEVIKAPEKYDANSLETKQKMLFDTLTLLTNKNFQIYSDYSSLYSKEIADYAETLEWAWRDFSKFEETSFSMNQLFSTIKEILAEILVVNSTLVEEHEFNLDGSLSADSKLQGVSDELFVVVEQSVKFFKDNWFMLGYDTYTDVQSELRQIRNKITTTA